MRVPSNEEIAWAAGLFEGEGSLQMAPSRKSTQSQVRLTLGSTDLDVLKRFTEIVGVGSIGSARQQYSPITGNPHKPIWYWAVANAGGVIIAVNMLKPWFGERRRERAERVLERAWEMMASQILRKAKFKDDQPALMYVIPPETIDMLGRCLGEPPK